MNLSAPTRAIPPPPLQQKAVALGASLAAIVVVVALSSWFQWSSVLWVGLLGFGVVAPVRLVAATIIFSIFIAPGILPPAGNFGAVTVQPADLLTVVLALRLLTGLWTGGVPLAISPAAQRIFGPLMVLLLYVGITLQYPWHHAPGHFALAGISYLRLVFSFVQAVLLHALLRTSGDVLAFWRLLAFGAVINVTAASVQWLIVGPASLFSPTMRAGGLVGVGFLGLLCAVVVIVSVAGRTFFPRPSRAGVAAGVSAGLLGLVLSKSVGGFAASAAGVATVWLLGGVRRQVGRRLAMTAVLLIVIATVALVLRGPDVRGLTALTGGSFTHRLLLAYFGLQTFLRHPLIGVGWQTSSAPEIIGDTEVNWIVLSRFGPSLSDVLLPGQTPTSLHSFVLQVLVELGILGALLCAAVLAMIIREAGILRRSPHAEIRALASTCVAALVGLGAWFLVNPMFGGQVDSSLLFLLLAALGGLDRLQRRSSEVPGDIRPP